jgi:pyruvate dehydrogenase complex dehydrogenase (E1) component
LYEPVDRDTWSITRSDHSQLLEGIASRVVAWFVAAVHYAHGINTIPFFVYYSMFCFGAWRSDLGGGGYTLPWFLLGRWPPRLP